MDNTSVGNFIKKLIKEKGITQEALSEQLNQSASAVSQKLNGKNAFSIEDIVFIAEITGVSEGEILHAGERQETEIQKAVQKGIDAIKSLEEKGIKLNSRDQYGMNSLDYAILSNSVEVAKYLIDNEWYGDGLHLDPVFITFLVKNDLLSYLSKTYSYSRTPEAKRWESFPPKVGFPSLMDPEIEQKLFQSPTPLFERLDHSLQEMVNSILNNQSLLLRTILPYAKTDQESAYRHTSITVPYKINPLLVIAVEKDDVGAFIHLSPFSISEDERSNADFYLRYAVFRRRPKITIELMKAFSIMMEFSLIRTRDDAEFFDQIFLPGKFPEDMMDQNLKKAVGNRDLEIARFILPHVAQETKNQILNQIDPKDNLEMLKLFLEHNAVFTFQINGCEGGTQVISLTTITGLFRAILCEKKSGN